MATKPENVNPFAKYVEQSGEVAQENPFAKFLPPALDVEKLKAETKKYEQEVPFTQRITDPLKQGIANLSGMLPGLEVSSIQKEINAIREGKRGPRDPLTGEQLPFQPEEQENAIKMLQEQQKQAQAKVMSAQAEAGKFQTRPAVAALSNVDSAREAFQAFQVDPLGVMSSVSLQSLPQIVPSLILGAVTRNPTVGALAMGSTSFAGELSSGVSEYFQEQGINIKDPVEVNKALNDPTMFAKAYEYALTRGSIIGVADTAAAGLASKLLVPKNLIKNQFAKEAVNIGVAQPVAQIISGAGGEAAAQLATEGEVTKPGQVLLEAAGEGPSSVLETAAFGGKRALDRLKATPTEAPPAPAVEPAPPAPAAAAPSAIITEEDLDEGLTPVSPTAPTPAPAAPAAVTPTAPPLPTAPTAEIAQRIEELDAELKAIDAAYATATPDQFSELNARQGEIKSEIARLFKAGTTGAPIAPVAAAAPAPAAPVEVPKATEPAQVEEPKQLAEKYYKPLTSYGWSGVETYGAGFPIVSKEKFVADYGEAELKKLQDSGVVDVHKIEKGAQEDLVKRLGDYKDTFGNSGDFLWTTDLTISPDTHSTPEYQANYERYAEKPYTGEYQEANQKDYTEALKEQKKRKPTKEEKVAANKVRQTEKKAAAEKAKQPVDTSGVKDLIEGKIKKVLGWTVYKRKEDPEFWYVQSPENHAANRIGQGDDVSTNLDTARARIEQHIADAEYDARKAAEKPAEVEPKIEDIVSPEVAASMKDLEFQNRLIKANKEKSITENQFSKLFKLYQDGKTPQADEQLTKMLAKNEKKAKAKEEPEEVPEVEIKEIKEFPKETPVSKEYQAAINKSRKATKAFQSAQDGYRKRLINDEEFMAARKRYDEAMAEYDVAYAKEAEKPEPVKAAPKKVEPKKSASSEEEQLIQDAVLFAKAADRTNMEEDRIREIVENARKQDPDTVITKLKGSVDNLKKQAQDNLIRKASEDYRDQIGKYPSRNADLINAVKGGALNIADKDYAEAFYRVYSINPSKIKKAETKDVVAAQIVKFESGIFPPGEISKPDYVKAAIQFLESPLTAKMPSKTQEKIILEGVQDIVPLPIEKKIAVKNKSFEDQKNALYDIAAPDSEIRYYLRGVMADKEKNRLVATDGHRAAIINNANFTGAPETKPNLNIITRDGKIIDGQFPDIDRVLPKEVGNLATINSKELGDYARGIQKAWRYVDKSHNPIVLNIGGKAYGFNSDYVVDLTNAFQKMGYDTFEASITGKDMLYAKSPDGKLVQVVMGMRDGMATPFAPFVSEKAKKVTKKSEAADIEKPADKPKETTEQYTQEEREDSEQHAKDLGGEIAYQKGDLALIRGYSLLTGSPKYAVAKGKLRTNVGVESYTGDLITKEEKAELIDAVDKLEKAAKAKHDADPFIKFENGIAISKDVSPEIAGVTKEWKRLLGLKANIYITTVEDARANKNNFTGPHRAIGSATLSKDEAGTMRKMSDSSYYITFEKSTSKTKMLEVIAHELGHVHEKEVFVSQTDEMKVKIRNEFDKWLLSQKGKSARELVDSMRAKTAAKTTVVPSGMKADDLSLYWKSFGEWYADQVSRWATTTDKPLTAVEKFFKRLGNQMRRFYGLLKNAGYLPNETFKQYLDDVSESQAMPPSRGEDSDFAPEAMVKKIEPLPKDELVESLLEKHNRPEAPRKPSMSVRDAFMGGYDNTKETVKDVLESPLIATNNMIGKADRALTYFRNKNIFFGYGLEEADRQRYGGQVRNAHQQAIASLAVVNALHSGNVGTRVMTEGKLIYDTNIKQFIAEKSDKSMANVVREKAKLIDKLGFETGNRVIQSYFEAKRSRSIVNEYVKREATYEAAIESGQNEEEARRDLANIEKAIEKVNMDDEAIDDFIALEKQYPELRNMMDNWTAVNQNMIDMMEFSGLISKQRAKSLRSIKDYVPWYRIMDDQEDIHSAPKNTRGLTNVAADKKFGPGKTDRDIDDIVDNMIHNVLTITRNTARNYAANRVVMEYGERYTEGKKAGKLRVFPKEGSDAEGVRFNIIANGRRIVVRIQDPLVAESVIGLENIDIPMNGALAFMANTLRRSITTFPAFQVAQLFMDAPTAALVTGLKRPDKVWLGVFTSFLKNLRKDDPIVTKFRNAGIGGYQSSARTPEKEIQLDIGLIQGSWFSKAMKGLDRFGDASDYAQRRSVYIQTMKETGDEMLAYFQANNVIDFKKRGSGQIAQIVTRQVAFMNAYAQAIDVLAKGLAGTGLKGIERRQALARMAAAGMMLASATLVYCFLVGDDEEYNKLDDQTKMRTIFIPGLGIRLPMHSGAAFFFKAIPELLYNAITKEGTKDEYDRKRLTRALSKVAADALLGPNPTPTGVKPVVEIALNRNFFTGGQVTPRGMEDLAAFRQYNQNTSELGKIISALTGTEKTRLLNPIEADHLIRGLTGTIGASVMWGTNLLSGDRPTAQAKDNPFYGQFIMPDVPRGREDLYYDLKEKTDEAYKTYTNLQNRGRKEEAAEWFKENKKLIQVYGYTSGIEVDLKRLNGEIRRLADLPGEKMSPDDKRKRMTELQEIKGRMLKDVISMRKRAGFDE
jgi:hypothetical protein